MKVCPQRTFGGPTRSISAIFSRARQLRGEATWVIAGQTIGASGALVGVRLLTGILSPTTYGEFALGMTIATLLNQAIFGPLTNGVTRFYSPAVEKNDLGSYLHAARRLVAAATCIVIGLLAIGLGGCIISHRERWIPLLIATVSFAVLSGYNSLLSGVQNAARQRSVVALHQGFETWTRFLCAALLVIIFGDSSSLAMEGYTVGIITILISQAAFFRKRIGRRSGADHSLVWRRMIFSYSWPFCSWSIFTWAQLSSDRWALALFGTTSNVGLYAALYQIGAMPIALGTTMMAQLLAPIFFQRAGDGNDPDRNAAVHTLTFRITAAIVALTLVLVAVTAYFHHVIFRTFVSPAFSSVSSLMPWMVLSSGLFSAGQTLELSIMSQMRTRSLLAVKIVTSSLAVLLNLAGAHWFGISGVVAAEVFFAASYCGWVATIFRNVAHRVASLDAMRGIPCES